VKQQSKPKILIAESDGFSDEALAILRQKYQVELADLDREDLLTPRPDVDVLWVRLRNFIDDEVMAAFPRLRAIATNTTGLNHIDLEVAEQRGIQIISLQGETEFLKTIRATAEHTIALTLALLRKIPQAVRHVQEGGWDRDQFRGSEIYGKTVGIIGYGRLGKIVAGYFEAFGANVIVNSHDLEPGTTVDGKPVVGWEELWRTSDIISLHANYDPANHEMVGEREFRWAQPTSVFINTARGQLGDEKSLANARSYEIHGAAIDVVQGEQSTMTGRGMLLRFKNRCDRCLITPHIGGKTLESARRTEEHVARKISSMPLCQNLNS